MATSAEEEATISIPSLAIVAVLGYFIYRYFFSSSSSSPSAQSTSRPGANGLRFTAAQVDQVAQMFPQLNRRDIMWDLHRNRGSVQATTERVLMGGRLEPAPPSFQPPPFLSTPSSPTSSTTAGGAAAAALANAARQQHPDLITRYNLQGRVISSDKGKEKESDGSGANAGGWATSKDQRQAMLQRRRDEMILAARRKMQERDALSGKPLEVTE